MKRKTSKTGTGCSKADQRNPGINQGPFSLVKKSFKGLF